MRLLKLVIKGVSLYKENRLELDFFATDRVPKLDGGTLVQDVTLVGDTTSIYSQNVVGISGVNATGKTTTLNLLRLALDVLSGDVSMRGFYGQGTFVGRSGEGISFEAIFWHDGHFFLLESSLLNTRGLGGSNRLGEGFSYGDETLWVLDTLRVNRKMVGDVDLFKTKAHIVRTRGHKVAGAKALNEEELNLLGPHRSIVSVATGRVRAGIEVPSRELPASALPMPVVQAFDASVEKLEWDPANEVYNLKFRGEQERSVDRNVARMMLSRGTVYGVEMVNQAIDVLTCGGYLIVDEMEEAINRSLVATVVDLFASPVTNPHGAQLVFSTHYPELLDVLHRKDDVYLLVRDAVLGTEVVKYSDRVARIETKKSEAVLSDLIRGTMPRYPDVRAMREYVRECVNGQA